MITRHARLALLALVALAALAAPARAQDAGGPGAPPAAATALAVPRASWLGDRRTLAVGDLLTIVVDEATAARERVSKVAVGNRSQRGGLSLRAGDPADPTSQAADLATGLQSQSRDVGETGRSGDLTTVLTVRVTALEPGGIARIEGGKTVSVDGRTQQVTVQGVVRTQDVMSQNRVLSSRIAEAVIDYRGKKLGPRTGIVGKFLNLLWP